MTASSDPPDDTARPDEADYEAFRVTLSSSARGRALLDEHARRNRGDSSAAVIEALARIESRLQVINTAQIEAVRADVRATVTMVRAARADIAAAGSEFARGARLMALLDMLERRLAAIAGDRVTPREAENPPSPPAGTAPAETAPTETTPTETPPVSAALPVPRPLAGALAEDKDLFEPAPPDGSPANAAPGGPSGTLLPAGANPADLSYDPLTPVMALTPEERLALVT